jgi:hypothetical protein
LERVAQVRHKQQLEVWLHRVTILYLALLLQQAAVVARGGVHQQVLAQMAQMVVLAAAAVGVAQ